MNIQDQFRSIVKQGSIEWSAHALRKMMERGISRKEVKHVICTGEIIEAYPDDKPFPSYLVLGVQFDSPLHLVVALNEAEEQLFLITAYRPDNEHFEPDFKTRRF